MSDYIIGCFAVAFRFCCSPGPLQFLLGIIGWLRDGENEPGLQDQTSANRRDQPRIVFSFDDGKMDRTYSISLEDLQQLMQLASEWCD